MKPEWMKKSEKFEMMDAKNLRGNFLPAILKKAQSKDEGEGLIIVQSFEPIPLYSALDELGFEHYTEKVSNTEYRVYFYRKVAKEAEFSGGADMPLKPTAIMNYREINEELADIIVNFWNLIWGKKDGALDMKTKLFLSLANAVGEGRMRQATRELIKAYAVGATVEELDELFALFLWEQGVGYFASEIGPSVLFAAYQFIKREEEKGMERSKIVEELTNKFGETNPDVSTMYRKNV